MKLCKLSTSHLPGIWVIETLARSNELDTSLLLDLLKKFPRTSDNLGGNARELVSFRILEFFLFRGAQSDSLSSSPKIAFDPSESCEDVLEQILLETPTSTWKATGPEMWKWDVQAFLAHKRTSFDNHSLLQLKDAILAGSHSFPASIKERSGLHFGNQPEIGLLENDGKCNGIMHRFERTDSNSSIVQGNDQVSPASVDNGYLLHTDLPNENSTNCFEKNDTKVSPDVNKQLDGCLENDNDECIYLKDRGGSVEVLPCEKQATCCNIRLPNDKCDDEHGLENEIREAKGEKEAPDSNEGMEPENIHISSDARYSAATNSRELNLLADTSAGLDESRDANSEFDSPKGVIGYVNVKMPNGKSHDALSDSDEYLDKITEIASKKNAFLGSQCTFSQAVDNSTQLNQNVCVKCNKGGEVLVCSTNGCPLVIHERCSCLSFGTMGEFYCPFCAYSQAISSYMDARKKASLKRKNLANFVCLEARKELKKQPEHDDVLHKSNELNVEDTAECINNHNARGKIVDFTSEAQAPYPLTIYREGRKDKGHMWKGRSERNAKIRSEEEVICYSEMSSSESKCLVYAESDDAPEKSENWCPKTLLKSSKAQEDIGTPGNSSIKTKKSSVDDCRRTDIEGGNSKIL